mmetsp:Transcript_7414/g.10687  ORF Transcript_7414/g.10687 Transcript_7414/m.10687 type:complete len:145 (-) Transcript_7414:205-639(-)
MEGYESADSNRQQSSSQSSLDACTSGVEDYRGHFCNYTEEHSVCALVGATKELRDHRNFWTATNQTFVEPLDHHGWECIAQGDFDHFVAINGCILSINCAAVFRTRTCETRRLDGAYALNAAQKCIAQVCGGFCGPHVSGFRTS